METTMLDAALSQGIWAVVAVFLLIYVVKSNEQRDKSSRHPDCDGSSWNRCCLHRTFLRRRSLYPEF